MKLSLSTISALTLTSLLMAAQPAAAQEQDTHQSDSVTNDTAASEGLWGTFKTATLPTSGNQTSMIYMSRSGHGITA
ncbi:Uncharacterised protein [Morganella morganii]|nr:Uncharacterised protein [Morganella morganii]